MNPWGRAYVTSAGNSSVISVPVQPHNSVSGDRIKWVPCLIGVPDSSYAVPSVNHFTTTGLPLTANQYNTHYNVVPCIIPAAGLNLYSAHPGHPSFLQPASPTLHPAVSTYGPSNSIPERYAIWAMSQATTQPTMHHANMQQLTMPQTTMQQPTVHQPINCQLSDNFLRTRDEYPDSQMGTTDDVSNMPIISVDKIQYGTGLESETDNEGLVQPMNQLIIGSCQDSVVDDENFQRKTAVDSENICRPEIPLEFPKPKQKTKKSTASKKCKEKDKKSPDSSCDENSFYIIESMDIPSLNLGLYNPRKFNLTLQGARYFVIKSYTCHEVCHSILNGKWHSTAYGNKRLDMAFRERIDKGPVYLLYSVNGSGHFCGVAQMMSTVDYEQMCEFCTKKSCTKLNFDLKSCTKFNSGMFNVNWIYVKDVSNNYMRHIKLENNENKPVTNSRDTQEVLGKKGEYVLNIIHDFKHTTSLLDKFIARSVAQSNTNLVFDRNQIETNQLPGDSSQKADVGMSRSPVKIECMTYPNTLSDESCVIATMKEQGFDYDRSESYKPFLIQEGDRVTTYNTYMKSILDDLIKNPVCWDPPSTGSTDQ